MSSVDAAIDSLKIIYENIPHDEKLYNCYEEFMKDLKNNCKEERVIKQLFIIKNRLECAQDIIQEFREKIEKEIEDNSKRRKIDI